LEKEIDIRLRYIPGALIAFSSLNELLTNGKICDETYCLSTDELEQIDALLLQEIPEVYRRFMEKEMAKEYEYQCTEYVDAIQTLTRFFMKSSHVLPLSLDTVLMRCGNYRIHVEDILESMMHYECIESFKEEEDGKIKVQRDVRISCVLLLSGILKNRRQELLAECAV